jgi:integrase
MHLTKSVIQGLRYEGRLVPSKKDPAKKYWTRDVRWDDEVPAFGVRVFPSDLKVFVLFYRHGPKQRFIKLGDFDPRGPSLDEFRKRARRELNQVEEGRDPLEEKRRVTQAKTFGDLLDRYINEYAKRRKKTWKKDQRRFQLYIPKEWRSRKAGHITFDDISDLHRRVGDRGAPYEANRLVEVLRKAFNLAARWNMVDPTMPNPARGIERFPEKKRKRWVRPEEVKEIAKAIDAEANVYVRAAIWLYLLTGVRRSELLQAKWSDIDWGQRMLRLPQSKGSALRGIEEEEHASLSGPALVLLQSVPREEKNPYILPGAKKGRHLVNIAKPWGRIRKAAGVEDVRLHDLRRTVGSWMSQSKVDLNTIKEALRHASISTTLTYARLGADPAREAIEDYGQRILAIAGKTEAGDVIKIKR